MKFVNWFVVACILGYTIFGIVATYFIPMSYDAWVTATCIFIFIIIGVYFYIDRKNKPVS